MIVDVQSRLSLAIMGDQQHSGLPALNGKKIIYDFGDETHLNLVVKYYNDKSKPLYPLIYNVQNKSIQESNRNLAEVDLKLIIATRNSHTEYKNTQRWATSYKNVLFPVASFLDTLFSKQSIFLWDGNYDLLEFPNYGNAKENETIDILDCLRFDTKIKINNNCLKTIKY